MQSFSKIIRPPLFIPQPSIHKVEKGQKYPELSPFPSPSISPSLCPSLPLSLSRSTFLPQSLASSITPSLASSSPSQSTSLRSWKSACYLWGFTVVSKKVPATYGDFIIFFKKKTNFENWSWIFFHLKKFLKFFGEIQWMTFLQTNYERSFKTFEEYFF